MSFLSGFKRQRSKKYKVLYCSCWDGQEAVHVEVQLDNHGEILVVCQNCDEPYTLAEVVEKANAST